MFKLINTLFGWMSSKGSSKPEGERAQRAEAGSRYIRREVDSDESVEVLSHHMPPTPFDLTKTCSNVPVTQWKFCDWQRLAQLDPDTLQHYLDRAKLGLLADAAHQQASDTWLKTGAVAKS